MLGPNGAGKSTTFHIISGLCKPDKGSVFIDGVDINAIRFKDLQKIRSSIGMVFQFGALLDSMNVEDNIFLLKNKVWTTSTTSSSTSSTTESTTTGQCNRLKVTGVKDGNYDDDEINGEYGGSDLKVSWAPDRKVLKHVESEM